jgi:Ca2+-binding RTX toxin-like protein
MTTVIGGDGKDTVDVRFDHYLNADLGDGDDRIILRARDLTTDDNIAGGAGRDTMQLSNESYDEELVGQSETGSTTGFEKFDLRNANITLRLTSDNFDTAENRAITVYTEEADRAELPSNLVALGLAQGMTVNQFTATAQAFGPTSAPGNDALARANLAKWLLNNSAVKGVDFADANGDGDNKLYTSAGSVPGTIAVESSPGVLPGTIDRLDRVNFRVEPDGYMAVDITAVPLSLASGRTFTLEGGNIRDVVIADDDSINGRSALRFDGPASVNQSVQDTLYVVGPADIEAADLRNVSGLENIILSPDGSQPGLWEVVLTAPVVNQTTGSAPLSIIALPEVPAGSELRVTLDPTVHSSSTNDVVIKRNSNISVYIDNVLVTEPNFGVTDYNTGVYSVTVINQLLFTTNADNLIGGAGSDEFLAQTVAQINSSDSADGMGGFDTAIFRFAVANPATTLRDQFENANFVSIEEFIFDTENNVSMNGLGLGYVPDLQRLQTGSGDDSLMAMRSGLEYALGGGDDEIGILGSATTTIDGGAGSDSVFGGGSNNYFRVRDVEFIDVDGGSDQVDLLDPNPDLVTVLNVETLNGSSGSDWVYADNNGGSILVDMGFGNDTLTVGGLTPTDATVYGGGNSDSLTVYATVSAVVYGDFGPGETIFDGNDTISVFVPDGDATIYGNGGDDNIYVDVESGTVVVYAGSGDDTVDVQAFPPGGGGTVFGGTGNDSINVFAWTNASISGGDGNDTIVSTWSDFTTIDGGSGDDSIDVVTFDNGTVLGGSGNDTINASGFGDDVIDGDEGDDLISATGSGDNTITGGAGNDTISLAGNANDAENILVFGDIAYDALQQQTTNTQGQDSISGFNFEDPAPGDPAPLAQDYMDFSVFLGPGPVGNAVTYNGTYVRGVTTVTANAAAGNSLVVVSNAAASFSAADFSVSVPGTIWLNDDASAVVVVGLDETGPGSGIGTFDVYYVEDIDTGAGQTWAVNLVANVSALTLVGVEAVIDNLIVT